MAAPNGLKRKRGAVTHDALPIKPVQSLSMPTVKRRLDSSSEGEGDAVDNSGGAPLLKINEEYAKRFEHNKRREELHRLQEKYEESNGTRKPNDATSGGGEVTSVSETDSEEEDDEGVLASAAIDVQIMDTLEAIRKKDPRVYDESATFFPTADDDGATSIHAQPRPSKAVFLSDYHRKNLLDGATKLENADPEPETYAYQQANLRGDLVQEIHNAAWVEEDDHSGTDENAFLVAKHAKEKDETIAASKQPTLDEHDVRKADEDPEGYLSKFMSARAWVPTERADFQPFDSDDDEEDRKAEAFEEAYNMRFDDPSKSNEKLVSHARDIVAKHSVRKDELNPRKKARELGRAKRDAEKQTRKDEKARLRKLKVSEAEEKLQKIKEAAGLRGTKLSEEDWAAFLEGDWDDEEWEQEMTQRFGEEYYARKETNEDVGVAGNERKMKKPRWSGDIDIDDIVPDFDNPQKNVHDQIGATDSSDEGRVASPLDETPAPAVGTMRQQEFERKEARRERRKIECLVDEQLDVDEALVNFGKRHKGQFRYRETSPVAFGLTAQDILMASDSQLNQYAGLKKMAAFRDSDKKRKDRKQLGKKARLRQWRKETFGDEEGPRQTLAENLGRQDAGPARGLAIDETKDAVDIKESKSRRRRSKKKGAGPGT